MWDQSLVDREFSYFKNIIYLNIASIAMPPERTQRALANYYNDFIISRNGDRSMLEGYEMANKTRTLIAELINCDASEVAFVQNTNAGIAIAAEGYNWKNGDNIIITDVEQSSNCYIWRLIAERFGVELRVAESDDGGFFQEDIGKLMDQNTRMVSISAVPYITGFFADVAAIGAECRKRSIIYVVDAIQALGRMKLDVQAMNIDFLSSGSHKGMMGCFGVGFIYCSRNILNKVKPTRVSMQSLAVQIPSKDIGKSNTELDWFQDARRFEAGSLPQPNIYALAQSVKLFLELGPMEIQAKVLELEKYLREKVETLNVNNIHIMSRKREKNRCGIMVIQYPEEKTEQVMQVLSRHKIYVTVRQGIIRISIGLYNTIEQMEIMANAIKEIDQLCHLNKV